MSKVIFGSCDGDSGMVICEDEDADTHESTLLFNCFGDGSHAFAALTGDEVQALHIGLSRYLGIPQLSAELVEEDD